MTAGALEQSPLTAVNGMPPLLGLGSPLPSFRLSDNDASTG